MNDTHDDLRTALDPAGLGDLADDLAPILTKIADQAAATATAPVRARQALDAEAALERRAGQELAAFEREVPDWKQHEAAMLELSKRIHPTESTTAREYLRTLHTLATKDQTPTTEPRTVRTTAALPADEENRTFDAAAAAARAGGEWEAPRAASTRSSSSGRTFEDAFAAAKRGERW